MEEVRRLEASELTVYFDFLCPWAYRAAMWLDDVERSGRIRARWQFFSLMENHRRREGTDPIPVWEKDSQAKGLPAFRAAIAARREGEGAYNRFRIDLQKARHDEQLPVDDPRTHRLAAERAGLDLAKFDEQVKRASLEDLAREHADAVRRGVFGVPTLVWPEGRSYYVKITDLVPAARAVGLYEAIEAVHRFGELVEIKTPESEGTLAA
jgi:predicted DsbA family dithiol-disulfide isomerase